MRVTHKPGTQEFKSGDMWKECDECGWDYYLSELKTRFDGALVCPSCYDPPPPDGSDG